MATGHDISTSGASYFDLALGHDIGTSSASFIDLATGHDISISSSSYFDLASSHDIGTLGASFTDLATGHDISTSGGVLEHGYLRCMEEDINSLLEKLNFSEEETAKIFCKNLDSNNSQGFEAWAIGKLLFVEKVNREAMYRVFKSIWMKILNLSHWMFDQYLFVMLPFVKYKEIESYAFNLSPFLVRIFNIPFECLDRSVAMEVGNAMREVIAIEWRDRDGGWIEYICLRVIIDISKHLRRVVQFVNREGVTTIYAIKYERLPIFCYNYGLISHSTQKCEKTVTQSSSNN
ncbi:hypothetical protein PVK06_047826 [Gossypium arboreum]|uniref:Zinc knuckle CX2CX4HX4C domain-containing protein n=1 Tax=Gossypium arboreum TaxID=29729 RepID=A0ABR0MEA9_GOSAR|nr:hypothetical protein PVK06_047826 [Gossypium arboreum]